MPQALTPMAVLQLVVKLLGEMLWAVKPTVV
jgi:hypothetical protein